MAVARPQLGLAAVAFCATARLLLGPQNLHPLSNSSDALRSPLSSPLRSPLRVGSYHRAFLMGAAHVSCKFETMQDICTNMLAQLGGDMVAGGAADENAFEEAVRKADEAGVGNMVRRAAGMISLYRLLFASGALVFIFSVAPAAVLLGKHIWAALSIRAMWLAQLLWEAVEYAHNAGALFVSVHLIQSAAVLTDGCVRGGGSEFVAVLVCVSVIPSSFYAVSLYGPAEDRGYAVRSLCVLAAWLSGCLTIAHQSSLLGTFSTMCVFMACGMVVVPLPFGPVIGFTRENRTVTVLCVGVLLMVLGPLSTSLGVPSPLLEPFWFGRLVLGLHAANIAALIITTPCYSYEHWWQRQATALALFASEAVAGALLRGVSYMFYAGSVYFLFFLATKLLFDVNWRDGSYVILLLALSLATMALAMWRTA